jgi:hypothetical protein
LQKSSCVEKILKKKRFLRDHKGGVSFLKIQQKFSRDIFVRKKTTKRKREILAAGFFLYDRVMCCEI